MFAPNKSEKIKHLSNHNEFTTLTLNGQNNNVEKEANNNKIEKK